MGKGETDKAESLYEQGLQLFEMYQETRNSEHVQEAIQKLRQATCNENYRQPQHLCILSTALYLHAKKTNNGALLDEAATLQQEAIDMQPTSEENMAVLKTALANILHERYRQRGNNGSGSDLNDGINLLYEAMAVSAPDIQAQTERQNNLATMLRSRFESTRTPSDLDKAIDFVKDALKNLQKHDPKNYRPAYLNTLGTLLGSRWDLDENTSDNDDAIASFYNALELVDSDKCSWKAAIIKTNIVERLTSRYKRYEEMNDLSESIRLLQDGIENTDDDDRDLPGLRTNLGNLFSTRYRRTGAMSDLEEGIRLLRLVIGASQSHFLSASRRHSNLAIMLWLRYLRTSDSVSLGEAEEQARKSIKNSPADNPEIHIWLFNLGLILTDIYNTNTSKEVLEEAIGLVRSAIDGPNSHHPTELEKANYLDALATILGDKYSTEPNAKLISDAILSSQESLARTPTDHAKRGERLLHLGILCLKQGDHKRAVESLEAALGSIRSRIWPRIQAGEALLHHYTTYSQWEKAYRVADRVVRLVPLLAPRSIDQADKQHLLRQVVGLASNAAAVALQANRNAQTAVELLEMGRCVLSGSLSKLREDVTALETKHPEFAARFLKVREELDPPPQMHLKDALREEASGHQNARTSQLHGAEQDLESLLGHIRAQDGFRNFLNPPTGDELVAAAKDAPIVMINTSKVRCDALIVKISGITSIRLETLDLEDIDTYGFDGVIDKPYVQEWLWDEIASPVLVALGFTEAQIGSTWPHVIWIPTGPLSRFPIHAAGYHVQKDPQKTVLDRVVSSYSVSVEATISSQRPTLKVSRKEKALLISMDCTPDEEYLPDAAKEIEIAQQWCNSMQLEVIRCSAMKKAVVENLRSCAFFHFAGHGTIDEDDPLKSRILLEDWKSDPFTVAEVLNINMHGYQPFMAYLSACRTGQIRHKQYLDESLHMISAFQLAGFRNVIGSLWKIDDESSMHVAMMVYQAIKKDGMSNRDVCIGLHHAVRSLRDKWVESCIQSNSVDQKRSHIKVLEIEALRERASRTHSRVPDMPSPNWIPYVHYGGSHGSR